MLSRAAREALIPGRTRLVMLESPTNPRMQICDLRTLTALAHEVLLLVLLSSGSLHAVMSAAHSASWAQCANCACTGANHLAAFQATRWLCFRALKASLLA